MKSKGGETSMFTFLNLQRLSVTILTGRDPKRIEKKVLDAGFTKQWNAHASLEYSPVHSLTGVYFDDGVLRFVWRKGLEFWLRDKTKDYQEEMDADTYQFRAYRLRGERSVTRFEMRPWILRATVVPFVILICYWMALR